MSSFELNFSKDQFLKSYWQKKPVCYKNAITNFKDPITPNELAGLSMEDFIDSREVSNTDNKWKVKQGPLSFNKKNNPTKNWMFLVQATNHWHDGVDSLSRYFDFLPNWLFDDIMVGFSTEDSSVGAHIDNYDVFILQGKGKRRWTVGDKEGNYKLDQSQKNLQLIENFLPMLDVTLEAGDLLYIPIGFPHKAIALEDSMSYSIGYRSPNQQEILSHYTDYLIDKNINKKHYINRNLTARVDPHNVSHEDEKLLYDMTLKCLKNQETFRDFLGLYLSTPRHELDIFTDNYSSSEVEDLLINKKTLYLTNGVKFIYFENEKSKQKLYINGQSFEIDSKYFKEVKKISQFKKVNVQIIKPDVLFSDNLMKFITKILNLGLLFYK